MSTFFSTLQRIVTLFLLLFCFCIYLIGTPSGLQTLYWLAKPYLPQTLSIQGLRGRLWDDLYIDALEYQNQAYHLAGRDIALNWQALSLLNPNTLHANLSWQQLKVIPTDKTPALQTQGTLAVQGQNTTLHARIQRETLQTTLTLNGQLTSKGLHATGQWLINEHLKSTIALHLPQFNLRQPNASQPLNSQLTFETIELRPFSPPGTTLSGHLNVQLFIQGPLNAPQYTGKLTLQEGAFEYPEWDLRLSSFNASLTSKNNQWQMQAHVNPLKTSEALLIQGKGENTSGVWTLRGEHIESLNTPNLHLWLSPNLTLSMKEGLFTLTGHLLVPEAQITPSTFSNTVHLTDDAVFVNTTDVKPHLPIDLNIVLEMGEKVALQLQEIKGLLVGKLTLLQTPQSPLVARGELVLQDGHYQSHGQSFQLKESKLIFSGETLDNPRLHILATRSIHQTKQTAAAMSQLFNFQSNALPDIRYAGQFTVGIEMTGRLKDPKVKLFSSPATLSEADILSFLLLGKPASEANQSGISLLMSAVNAYHLDSTTQGANILQNLKSRLALDVDIQSNQSNQTQQKTSATVGIGKAITERAYIHYSVNPFQDNSNVVTLTYLLNKFFSIQISASDIGNGIDLLYTHSEP